MNLFLTGDANSGRAALAYAEQLGRLTDAPVMARSARTAMLRLGQLEAAMRDALALEVAQRAARLKIETALLSEDCDWRSFALLAVDMDSTLITIECIDEIAAYCGKKAEVAAITEAAMRGELTDYGDSLRQRVALLRGIPASALDAVYEQRLALSEGAQALINQAQQHDLVTLLVSGGFTFFTDRLKHRLGIDHALANQLVITDGKLQGTLDGPLIDGDAKRRALEQHCRHLGVSTDAAIAVGDGANDLPMMGAAGLSVAYHAKERVNQAADVVIRFLGLDVLNEWLQPADLQSIKS